MPDAQRLVAYEMCIEKTREFVGIDEARTVFEDGISKLADDEAKELGIKYADFESALGEIDRARAILVHTAQFCDSGDDTTFWEKWRSFEVEYGNEDTFREMLR